MRDGYDDGDDSLPDHASAWSPDARAEARAEVEAERLAEAEAEARLALPDAEVRLGYSGRGMYGKLARLAVTSETAPAAPGPRRLIEAGWSYDSMGRGYVYFLR